MRGIQVAVHFSFFLLAALFAEYGWLDGGGVEALVSVGLLFAFFVCVTLHEFGHSLVAQRFGVGVPRILLLPIGGMAEFDSIPRRPRHELLIAIAGPAVNFGIVGILGLIWGWPDFQRFVDGEVVVSVAGIAHVLLAWNLLMGCFNLLPVFPMDGGRILRALLARRLPYVRATFIAATLGKILAIAGVAVALYLGAGIPVGVFAFVFLFGEMEYRAAKRHAADEAHWRAVLARPEFNPPVINPSL